MSIYAMIVLYVIEAMAFWFVCRAYLLEQGEYSDRTCEVLGAIFGIAWPMTLALAVVDIAQEGKR